MAVCARLVFLSLLLVAPGIINDLTPVDSDEEEHGEALNLISTRIVVEHSTLKASDGAREESSTSNQTKAYPWSFYHYSMFPLLATSLLAAWFTRPRIENPDDITPVFRLFRYKFLAVWGLAAGADWLQGPYVYALYDSYGYDKSDIDKLFVAGFAASMTFGTFVGSLADAWGRKRTTLIYCGLYIASCLTKHCSTYHILMFGRITGGCATSLLFSVFECWMVNEVNERYQFGPALLRYMFSMMYFVNYLVAIFSGLLSEFFVETMPMRRVPGLDWLHYGGNICPFDLAIMVLCFAFVMICFTWHENYGNSSLSALQGKESVVEAATAALRVLRSSWKVPIIGLVIACFEGGMYCFVINWTPSLSLPGAPHVPHGLIFSALMMSCMVGSSVFSFFNPGINPAKVVVFACAVSGIALAMVAYHVGVVSFVSVIYMSFLVFECCVGLYFPSMGVLKSIWVPEHARAGVYNLFRVPLNIVVCSVILTDMRLKAAFIVCSCLMATGAIFIIPLSDMQPPGAETAKSSKSKSRDV